MIPFLRAWGIVQKYPSTKEKIDLKEQLSEHEKEECDFLLKIGNFETFYDILTQEELATFCLEFYRNQRKFNLEYELLGTSLENPYVGHSPRVVDLAKFAVEVYNNNNEPIDFVRVMRVLYYDYKETGESREQYSITLEAKDKIGAQNVYHVTVVTECMGAFKISLGFHLACSSPGQLCDGKRHFSWERVILLVFFDRQRRLYEERLLSLERMYRNENELTKGFDLTSKPNYLVEGGSIFPLYPYDDDPTKPPAKHLLEIAQFVAEQKALQKFVIVKVNCHHLSGVYYMTLTAENVAGLKSTYRARVYCLPAPKHGEKKLLYFDEQVSASSSDTPKHGEEKLYFDEKIAASSSATGEISKKIRKRRKCQVSITKA